MLRPHLRTLNAGNGRDSARLAEPANQPANHAAPCGAGHDGRQGRLLGSARRRENGARRSATQALEHSGLF